MSVAELTLNSFDAPAAHGSRAIEQKLRLDVTSASQWDRSIAEFDDVCTEQVYAFARHRWSHLEREPILFRRGDEIVGGAMLLIQRLPLGLGTIAVGKWTPMLRDRHAADAPQLYAAMVEAMIGEYARKRGMVLSLLPHVSPMGDTKDEEFLRRRGFIETANVPFPIRYIIDLSLGEAEHRAALNTKCRYHLTRSEKANLEFIVAGPEEFGEFDILYQSMSDRKRFPDYSAFSTVPMLLALEDKVLRPKIFLVKHEGQVVAGAVIFTAGETAVYLYGATNSEALPLRAGFFMHWNIIGWLKANTNARYYDLGGCDGFKGLHQFKKSFVGKAGGLVPMPSIHHYAESWLKLRIGIAAFKLRGIAMDLYYRYLGGRHGLARPDLSPSDVQ